MSVIDENGLLGKSEFEDFKTRSWRAKFFQAIFQGVGAAIMFGVVGSLVGLVSSGAVVSWPLVIGLATVSMSCIALGTRFMFENQMLDQDFQAKKIAAATSQTQAVSVAQSVPESTKIATMPPGMATHADETPDAKWAEKFAQRSQGGRWAEEVRLNEAQDETKQRVH